MDASQSQQNQPDKQTARPQSESRAQFVQRFASYPLGEKLGRAFPILLTILIVAAGIFTGLILSSKSKGLKQGAVLSKEELSPEIKESLEQTFRDEAEGTLEKNDDLDKYAQGTHKLIRPGGEEQTAYLTSSVLDLDEYVDKKIKVYGETFGSSQVGWLMDVGKVEIIE